QPGRVPASYSPFASAKALAEKELSASNENADGKLKKAGCCGFECAAEAELRWPIRLRRISRRAHLSLTSRYGHPTDARKIRKLTSETSLRIIRLLREEPATGKEILDYLKDKLNSTNRNSNSARLSMLYRDGYIIRSRATVGPYGFIYALPGDEDDYQLHR
ncbi:MAG: hypothetical protein QW112_03900, partial [Candidatus Micrarchaeia archaeon]